jgi:hypothetical protein
LITPPSSILNFLLLQLPRQDFGSRDRSRLPFIIADSKTLSWPCVRIYGAYYLLSGRRQPEHEHIIDDFNEP